MSYDYGNKNVSVKKLEKSVLKIVFKKISVKKT